MKLRVVPLIAAAVLSTIPALAGAASGPITEAEVIAAENAWGEQLVAIGKAYTDGKDYKAEAARMVDEHYAYGDGTVLFKPTRAAEDEFRETREEALSYFIGGVDAEDHGFALQPWSHVRFENDGIVTDSDSAEAMGVYHFTDAKTLTETKVEYTFGFKRAEDGHLEIFLHHSSLPYVPTH